MSGRLWTSLFLVIGLAIVGSTLASHDWVIDAPHQDYRWGLHSTEFCGDSDCRTETISSENVNAWETFAALGPIVFLMTLAGLIAGLFVLVRHVRGSSGEEPANRPIAPVVAAVRLLLGLAGACAFVASRPIEGVLGWAYPAYLHGGVLALVGVWMTTRGERAGSTPG